MTSLVFELVLMLLVILLASELFTNALEHLGAELRISEGVTGSLFAAVGTALPETIVPLLAIFAGTADARLNEEVGVGAILGAPLMLSTLSTCLMAVAALPNRGARGFVSPERSGFVRDIDFFLVAFVVAAAAMFVPHDARYVRAGLSVILVITYFVYTLLTLRASDRLVDEGHGTRAHHRLFLARIGAPENITSTSIQLAAALALLIFGAKGFIDGVEGVSALLGISALLLSLLIIPIATELPEKVNSILWIRRGKDTLAFGNITGAMVFQGTLLPAVGIMLTPWQPRMEVLSGVIVTLAAAAWLRLNVRSKGLRLRMLLVNGMLYAAYLGWTLAGR
jgi:cation:H+ antiporter